MCFSCFVETLLPLSLLRVRRRSSAAAAAAGGGGGGGGPAFGGVAPQSISKCRTRNTVRASQRSERGETHKVPAAEFGECVSGRCRETRDRDLSSENTEVRRINRI